MQARVAPQFLVTSLNKEVDYLSDTIKCILLTSTHTPDIYVDKYLSDVVANELSGGSYARATLSSKTEDLDDINGIYMISSADVVFTGITAADIAYAYFADTQTASDATSPIIGWWDFQDTLSVSAENFTLVPSTSYGLFAFYV